jgi:integrase
MPTIDATLESYLLYHDLRDSTVATYRRIVSTYRSWQRATDGDTFDAEAVSRFLRDKQTQGTSSHYRRSCRSTLVALLRHGGDTGRVRSVRTEPLEPRAWSADEVARLVAAVPQVARWPEHQRFWQTLIQAAWYSGLNWCDLREIQRADVPDDGRLIWRRSKTNRRVVVYLPPACVAHVASGPVWIWPLCEECFRQQFARIVRAAGIDGSFKRLRKSAGNEVEKQQPGTGHQYLGDSRPVFERHYLAASDELTARPPPLPLGLWIATAVLLLACA